MEFRSLGLDGPFEILPRRIEDSRGYFSETFRRSLFAEKVGPVDFVQENQSLSTAPGTIRGIHFQSPPSAQGKLVR
ncbi:MAG TPA: dTDP-4-dehydrorhamnose 3,5-epimerase family protein, partial [Sphingomicrobium sp.]|nr:dTDP-4-dehydrorhamnose 3,5-epimerase family protein [Sphingomicrobium sp.]